MFDPEKVREKLAPPLPDSGPEGIPAAVLAPFIETPGGWELVFTRRRRDLRSHPGQISFPGGKVDEGEDSLGAALREFEEELGVPPHSVDVLGGLAPIHTLTSGFVVRTWVAVVTETVFLPNPGEIESILKVPLATLLDPATRRDQRFIRAGAMYLSPAYDVGDEIIWGVTAKILDLLIEAVR